MKCQNKTDADWKTLCSSCWKNRTPEEIRAYRQQKLNCKLARMQTRAQRLEYQADQKQAEFNSHRGDIAFLTQPANPRSTFGKQRQKITDRYEKGIELHVEAQDLRNKAAWLEKRGVAVKGDAETRRQAKRKEQDKLIAVGSKVHDFCFGDGAVVKVNKKTYTIKFASGFTCTRDKTYVEVL